MYHIHKICCNRLHNVLSLINILMTVYKMLLIIMFNLTEKIYE